MKITRKWWNANIRPLLNQRPSIILENEMVEFCSKALDRIKELEDRYEPASHKLEKTRKG